MKTLIILTLFCGSLYASDITNTSPFWRITKISGTTNQPPASMADTNGFGVQFALIEDKKFFDNWNTPAIPHFTNTFVASRGVPIYTMVVFAGAGLRSDGTADVTYDVIVRKPDGSIYGQDKDLIGVKERIDPDGLYLVRDYFAVRIEPNDPAGEYTVEISVRDNVKKSELHLKRKFTVEK